MDNESNLAVIKALSNETRLLILQWLKDPETNFGPQPLSAECGFDGGVCVGSIQEKSGLAQSVISGYLSMMQKAGLLESRRVGQWTYYRRNEPQIAKFLQQLAEEL